MKQFTKLQRTLTYKGKTLNFHEWAKITGLSFNTIYSRFRRNYSVEEILFRVPKNTGRPIGSRTKIKSKSIEKTGITSGK